MDQSPKTSFIPKEGSSLNTRQRRSVNIVAFLATIFFLATLIFSGGVYIYELRAERILTEKKEELAKMNESFPSGDIDEIKKLEKRITTASSLLDQHLSFSRFLDILASSTQQKAQWDKFSFTRLTSGVSEVTLSGSAATFNTLVLQEQLLSSAKVFKRDSLILSGVSAEGEDTDERKVVFQVAAHVDPGEILFKVASTEEASTTVGATSSTSPTTTAPVIVATTTPLQTVASTTP